MARGGHRDGAGRKPKPVETIPAEPKLPASLDGARLAEMLPMFAEMSQRMARGGATPRTAEHNPFKLPAFPKAAIPTTSAMAMDNMPAFSGAATDWLGGGAFAAEGLTFLGYTYLAELAQRPEYRTMAETIADDATRRWVDFDVVGDEKKQREDREKDPAGYDERMADPDERKKRVEQNGKADKVKALRDDQERLELRSKFYWASCFDSYMGRAHLYLQIGDVNFDAVQGEMASPIGTGRDDTSATKVSKENPLKRIQTLEPMWAYPLGYNAQNPLSPDWYNPQTWYVMGRSIHISRMPTFIGRQVPDMLKPAYAFGGLPLTQLAKPYVDIWLQTRQSVADMLKSFSVMVLQTDLAVQTQPGNATQLLARAMMFNMLRDNQGLFITNKNTEDFKNVSAPLGGLHELQAQSQEHMLSVARIPAVKFTGIQPAGLNASSEGEIKVYDDTIEAYQKRVLDPNLTRIINFEMLSLWGEVDPEITHRWEQLRQLTDAEKEEQNEKKAKGHQIYVDMGAISPAEVRKVVIDDPESPFAGLDPDDVPEPPMPEPGAGEVDGEGESGGEGENAGGQGGGANDAADPFGGNDRLIFDAALAEWNEDDHPRAKNGQFGSGGGSAAASGKSGKGDFPEIPDFLKRAPSGASGGHQRLKMPQYGLTPTPWESHQAGGASLWKPAPRGPMPASEGEPEAASSVVVFSAADDGGVQELNGVAFESYDPPEDWAGVDGQAEIDEPALPDLPKGMTLSSGVIIREPDGRIWLMRPSKGFGGYDQTFPKGGVEEGLSPQANAIKEAYEETGLKVRITGFAGDHEGDVTVSRFYYAEREGGDPIDAGEEAEAVILAPPDKLDGMLNRKRDKNIAAALAPKATQNPLKSELDPADLKKEGGKLGSNEGGTFTDKDGNKFYIKRPETKAHVANELAAARLYQLAGVQTLDYRPVKGGNHVATAWENLDKNNISKMSAAERKEATKDFAVHAWLSNWDAAGTGGDNQGVRNGKPVTLDVGGSLRYRAQGGEKGKAFGSKVTEIDTMRDPAKSYDAGKLFGKMSDADLKASVERVTSIPNSSIRAAVGDDKDLADTLIARKADLAKRFGTTLAGDEAAFEESKHPRAPDGKFTSGGGGAAESKLDEALAGFTSLEPDEDDQIKKFDADSLGLFDDLGDATIYQVPAKHKQEFKEIAKKAGLSVESIGDLNEAGTHEGFIVKEATAPTTFASKKEHVAHLLKQGTTTKEILAATGWPSVSVPQQAAAAGLKLEKYTEGGVTKYKGVPMTDAEKAALKAAAIAAKTTKVAAGPSLESMAGQPAPKLNEVPKAAAPAPKPAPPAFQAPPSSFPPPTPAEKEKAKKSTALSMQYVPGAKPEMSAGQPYKDAENLIKAFNAKYAGKSGLTDAQLATKVNDFKALTAGVEVAAQIEKSHFAEIAKKAKAEQAAAAQAQAEKAKAEAHAAAQKNAEFMKGLGISETQAQGMVALAKMLGKTGAHLAEEFKRYEENAKSYGYPISGFEAALIANYSDGGFHGINDALRSGKWTPAQHVYVSMVNKALKAMPTYKGGGLTRNTNLTPEQQAAYVSNHVIQEAALMSTSTGSVFSGNTTFKVTAIGKRGASIKKLSHHASEDEVLFAAKTYFHVDKVEGTPGGKMTIHMTEWEDI